MIGLTLGKDGFGNGNRFGADDIAPDNRWFNAPGAIALNPTIIGKAEPAKVFAKIFHHVVAFEFTVHENIQADLFLESEPFDFFFVVEGGVFVFGNFVAAELGPIAPNFSCLGE